MKDFSEIPKGNMLLKGKYFFILQDSFPVSPGHLLIISNNSKKNYFELNKLEVEELNIMIHQCKKIIEKEFKPDGYNIGMNCGEAAGQSVFQFHCHVIPRYIGDMKNPRGGVRHCIEGKGYY
jgi:diadenosine tetraphosphate (Ap4A) HIT family hydrolase